MKFTSKFGIPIFDFDSKKEQDYLSINYGIEIFIDGIADFIYELPLYCIKSQKYGGILAKKSYEVCNENDIWKIFKANAWFLDFKNKQIVDNLKYTIINSNNHVAGLYLGDKDNNFVSGYYDITRDITTIYDIGNL